MIPIVIGYLFPRMNVIPLDCGKHSVIVWLGHKIMNSCFDWRKI